MTSSDEQMRLLGEVTYWSAEMESLLRDAFCALVGSKFAAIAAARQSVTWLIEQCQALTDAHHEMPQTSRKAIKTALNHCKTANGKRNALVHGTKTSIIAVDGSFTTTGSQRGKYDPVVQSWTLAALRKARDELARACVELLNAVSDAFGDQMMMIGWTLNADDWSRKLKPTR
jgi:hypothetical protein